MQRDSGQEQGSPCGSGGRLPVAENPNRSQQLSPENGGDAADDDSPPDSRDSDPEDGYASSEFSSLSFVQKGTPAPWVLWNRSFQDLVNSPVGIEQFRLYVDKHHPADNCMYLYLLIKGWKQKNLQENLASADAIQAAWIVYNGYIAPDRGTISENLQKEAQRVFKERGARDLQEVIGVFGHIYNEAWRVMEGTLYREYLASESYAEFVQRAEVRYEKELAEAAAIRAACPSPEPTPLMPVAAQLKRVHSSRSSSPREPPPPVPLRRADSQNTVALGHGGDCRGLVAPPVPPRDSSVNGGPGRVENSRGTRMVENERPVQQQHLAGSGHGEAPRHPVYMKTTHYSLPLARESDADTQSSSGRGHRVSSSISAAATQSKTYQSLQKDLHQALLHEMAQMNRSPGLEEAKMEGDERQRTADPRRQTAREAPPSFHPEQLTPRLLKVIVERRETDYNIPQREFVVAQNDQAHRYPQASPYTTYNAAVRHYATASTVAAGDVGYGRVDHYQRHPPPSNPHPPQYAQPTPSRQNYAYTNVSDTGASNYTAGYAAARVAHPLHQKHDHNTGYQPAQQYGGQRVLLAPPEEPWVVLWKIGENGDCFMTNMAGRKCLGNFKQILPKKLQIGPCTKYYFRDFFEDLNEPVWSEVKHDNDELPLYEGRIMGLVEL